MTLRMMALLVLAIGTTGATSQAEEIWMMRIHKGEVVDEHAVAEIDSLTFYSIDSLICDAGYADCNGVPEDSCEVDLNNDVINCGSCGYVCDLPHTSTHVCSQGECLVETCESGWENCDGIDENGCETSVSNDVNNCGNCDYVCDLPNTATHVCVDGVCRIGTCIEHFANCNADDADGCETYLGDVSHTENSCSNAILLGSVCGDEGLDIVTQAGRGSKWYRVEVQECNNGDVDLSVRITLSSPGGTNYDLRTFLGSCGTDEQWSTGGAEDCISYEWSDVWLQTDDKWIYIEVFHEYGNACEDYTLAVYGNAVCS